MQKDKSKDKRRMTTRDIRLRKLERLKKRERENNNKIKKMKDTYKKSQKERKRKRDRQDLLNSYKKIHTIFTNQQKAIQYAYEQFSDFDNAAYKQKLLKSYNTIHSIHKNQQKAIQYAYEQFSDFENAAYKQKLLKSYNTIHSIHKNQQKAIQYAYEQFSDFDAVYKQKLLKSYNTIHSIFVNQQKHIQSALKYFKEKTPPPAQTELTQATPVNPSSPQKNDLENLIITINKTQTVDNMENVMKLLGMLKNYENSKALSLVIMASLTFINNNRSDPNLGELIEKLNEILGPSIHISPSIIENDKQKNALLKMVQDKEIINLYSQPE